MDDYSAHSPGRSWFIVDYSAEGVGFRQTIKDDEDGPGGFEVTVVCGNGLFFGRAGEQLRRFFTCPQADGGNFIMF